MSNLKNLKNARECYKSISVAHDLTPGQRQQVKELLLKSKDTLVKREADSDRTEWKTSN